MMGCMSRGAPLRVFLSFGLLVGAACLVTVTTALAQPTAAPATSTAVTTIQGPPPPIPPEVVARDEQGRVTMRAIRVDKPLDCAVPKAARGLPGERKTMPSAAVRTWK